MAGPMAAHDSAVYMDPALFARIDALHERRRSLGLTAEQQRLVERLHLDFVRSGAQLDPPRQARYAAVMEELAQLTTQFAQNVLHDESTGCCGWTAKPIWPGCPTSSAPRRGRRPPTAAVDGHVITLSRSLVVPFLSFSERRDLREQAWRAWVGRGEHAGEHDNREVARAILRLRNEQARLHGRKSTPTTRWSTRWPAPAARCSSCSAKSGRARWPRSTANARRSSRRSAPKATRRTIEAWDWRYWAEKVRRVRYAIDDAEVKPYFRLENMVAAAFDCARRLFGLRFSRARRPAGLPPRRQGLRGRRRRRRGRRRLPAGQLRPRQQAQRRLDEFAALAEPQRRRAAAGDPEQQQLRQGFARRPDAAVAGRRAHAVPRVRPRPARAAVRTSPTSACRAPRCCAISSSCRRRSSSTGSPNPRCCNRHARHWQTGEPIPAALVDRLHAARRFNQGYETVRYTASAIVDMAVHAIEDAEPPADLCAFEDDLLREQGLPHGVGINHRLVHFQHLFSGSGYAAGYYVYLWAEVLDADGYDAFVEAGSPFAPDVAERLKRHVYAAGNSVDPAATYARVPRSRADGAAAAEEARTARSRDGEDRAETRTGGRTPAREDRTMEHHWKTLRDAQVSTATLTTVLLKKGLRNVWLRGPMPLQADVRAHRRPGVHDAFRSGTRGHGDAGGLGVADVDPRRDRGDARRLRRDRRRDGGERRRHLRRHPVRAHGARQVAALVTDGAVRDLQGVLDTGLPVWAGGVAAPPSVAGLIFVGWQETVGCGGVAVFPGDTIVADRDGAVVIPQALLAEVVTQAVEQETFEAWVVDEVKAGRPLVGLYPPDDATKARYAASAAGAHGHRGRRVRARRRADRAGQTARQRDGWRPAAGPARPGTARSRAAWSSSRRRRRAARVSMSSGIALADSATHGMSRSRRIGTQAAQHFDSRRSRAAACRAGSASGCDAAPPSRRRWRRRRRHAESMSAAPRSSSLDDHRVDRVVLDVEQPVHWLRTDGRRAGAAGRRRRCWGQPARA